MSHIPADPPSREQACAMAEAEYAALLGMLGNLDEAQWGAVTECAPWTVRDLVAHLTGAAEEAVRLRVQLRHLREARRQIGSADFVDVLNAQQLADRVDADSTELLAELADLAKRAPRARMRTPRFVRRRPLPPEAGGQAGDTMAYLIDVIYTRDLWMHRIDIARATGCELTPSGAEQTIVEQILRDLDRGWSHAPLNLGLSGRVRGTWTIGGAAADAPSVAVDTLAACRLWSGRGDETGLKPGHPTEAALLASRLLF